MNNEEKKNNINNKENSKFKYKECDPQYKGERINRDLVYGPIPNKDRGCTNLLCVIFFIAFWVGAIALSGVGFEKGNLYRLGYPYDTDGKKLT
jgi:hypothetical protein